MHGPDDEPKSWAVDPSLDGLGEPTIEGYFADYDAALAKKDRSARATFVDRTLAYLSSGVVGSLE